MDDYEYRLFEETLAVEEADADLQALIWLNQQGTEGWLFINVAWSVLDDTVFHANHSEVRQRVRIRALGARRN